MTFVEATSREFLHKYLYYYSDVLDIMMSIEMYVECFYCNSFFYICVDYHSLQAGRKWLTLAVFAELYLDLTLN